MIEDEEFLKQAIEIARQARADGNHPFGALLVLDAEDRPCRLIRI